MPSSIDLLKRVGLDFDSHKTQGIDPKHFGEHMFTSGILHKLSLKRSCA